ncbi:MAG: site-specific DNA-methyltransferase [Deltaproteobacteria bacterium]|nr:site-specific DNA-methyltransferase [Deltaproteobacteria bacterium]
MSQVPIFYPRYQSGLNPETENDFNRFYYGDNVAALKELCLDPAIKGKVKLIYIDPPYSTGQAFIGSNYENAYMDRFKNDEEFLDFLEKRLVLLHELLAFDGSIYLHIDTKIGHYAKILMDKIFGKENYRNEITRIKCNPKNFFRKAYGNVKDVIFFYSKTKPSGNDPMVWNDYRRPLTDIEIAKQFPKIDKNGRRYATTPLHAKGETIKGPTGQPWKGRKPPKGRHWRYPPEELTRLDEAGLIEWSATGNPRKIIYADENAGKKIQDVWVFKDKGFENSMYPTEKNREMLDQIILQSSNEGDTVLDCFAGCGTTLLSSEKHGRRWIGIDNSRVALFATLKNLFSNKVSSRFTIYYPELSAASSDLEITLHCINKVEPRKNLFDKQKDIIEVHITDIKTAKKYQFNNPGLIFSAFKQDDTYLIHNETIDYKNGNYSVSIHKSDAKKDIFLIVFDIHGNECIVNISSNIFNNSNAPENSFFT